MFLNGTNDFLKVGKCLNMLTCDYENWKKFKKLRKLSRKNDVEDSAFSKKLLPEEHFSEKSKLKAMLIVLLISWLLSCSDRDLRVAPLIRNATQKFFMKLKGRVKICGRTTLHQTNCSSIIRGIWSNFRPTSAIMLSSILRIRKITLRAISICCQNWKLHWWKR